MDIWTFMCVITVHGNWKGGLSSNNTLTLDVSYVILIGRVISFHLCYGDAWGVRMMCGKGRQMRWGWHGLHWGGGGWWHGWKQTMARLGGAEQMTVRKVWVWRVHDGNAGVAGETTVRFQRNRKWCARLVSREHDENNNEVEKMQRWHGWRCSWGERWWVTSGWRGRNCEVREVWMTLRSRGLMMRLGRCIWQRAMSQWSMHD
jgi:hypothetical protein